ncbi:helix-turn-helix domain-containing protein [Leptobacterium flavescens]|uniref:Helix-turn-helix domain-containing protein n=1 Tax=Leptobacterium flavescens TaxID=472055 RepID=A0A6P0UNY1_9FLAO|nr:AraC family transcriptional regulator [Leptobacterium flavescens]NER14687.1 helix-turn-helix domain-containing protein [Leptobacterium flavescens]
MKTQFNNGILNSERWELGHISMVHSIVDYKSPGVYSASNDTDLVRLHFGISGDYDFNYKQLNSSFKLRGTHNNIMYSDGLDLEIFNKSERIETFGINFSPDTFIKIAQNGNDSLKRFADKVVNKENTILSDLWRPNTLKIHQVIDEIVHCNYSEGLKDIFLLSKSMELLVLQTSLYDEEQEKFIKWSTKDKNKLFLAREILDQSIDTPPTIHNLSRQINLNEYKLKKGFRELFGTTVFGYIHKNRMSLAKKLLLGTDKSAKEIAYEIGYSSPQHFSKAFKKEFSVSPNSIRNTPDPTI